MRLDKSSVYFFISLNLIVVLLITGASYYHIPLKGGKDTLVYLLHLISLQVTVAGLLYFLSLRSWVHFWFLSPLLLILAGFAFWGYSQDLSVTPHLIQAILETKADIAVDLINGPFVLYLSITLLFLWAMARWRAQIKTIRLWSLNSFAAVLCVLCYPTLETLRPGSLQNRLPYNLIYALAEYGQQPNLKLNLNPDFEFIRNHDSLLVVLVVGESVRADHLSINGYKRETTPNLAALEGLITFPNISTTHTYTGASLPQILTDQGQERKDQVYNSIYSVLNKAAFETFWVGNQTLEKSYAPVVATNDSVVLIDAFKSVFSFDKRKDNDLLTPLEHYLPSVSRSVVSLHMIGSHWWYEDRYTEAERRFTPVIDSKYIPSLTEEQLINSYDNTLVYLDGFLYQVVEKLKDFSGPSVMVYISDHGEQLGENGKWLHAQAGEAAKNPAYMIWFSQRYQERFPENVAYFREAAAEKTTTDRVYYDLLHICGLKTPNL
jgi:lipid A ethanolaminephosphotransferase